MNTQRKHRNTNGTCPRIASRLFDATLAAVHRSLVPGPRCAPGATRPCGNRVRTRSFGFPQRAAAVCSESLVCCCCSCCCFILYSVDFEVISRPGGFLQRALFTTRLNELYISKYSKARLRGLFFIYKLPGERPRYNNGTLRERVRRVLSKFRDE